MKDPFSLALPSLRARFVTCDVMCLDDAPLLQQAAAYPEIWPHMLYDGSDPKEFSVYINDMLHKHAKKDHLPFTVRLVHGEVIGAFKLMNIDVRNDSATMGGTWLTPSIWGSGVNTELRSLVFQFVFEFLEVNRLEIRVHTINQRNFAALQKLGATHEGTLRSHFTQRDSSKCDVAVFSILRHEWPQVKAKIAARIETQLGRRPFSSELSGDFDSRRLH